jgi:BlaI family transcriptional regulator, penicillinase repressor
MRVLWESSPASARHVVEAVRPATGWAYTTGKTILHRLIEKEVLRTRKRANVLFYAPRLSRDAARKRAVGSLVERAFEGAFGSHVQHLVSEERLTARERAELRALLDAHDREQGREEDT